MQKLFMVLIVVAVYIFPLGAVTSFCETCHKEITPEIVQSFNQGRMADGLTCMDCHGNKHNASDNAEKVQMPDVHTCAGCHGEQVALHQSGRHNMDLAHLPPMLLRYHNSTPKEDCASCHRDSRSAQYADFGGGEFACLTCHQAHTFLTKQTKGPDLCKECHALEGNDVWQAWSASPHGQIYLDSTKTSRPAPYCQTCHMNEGDHRMESLWGAWDLNLFIRDSDWRKSQQSIRRALFSAAHTGQAVLVSDSVSAKRIRIRYRQVCLSCHTEEFVAEQRNNINDILKQADALMSAAIAVAANVQNGSRGLLQRGNPEHSKPPVIETLQKMFFQHRRQVYRAALHVNYKLAAAGLQKMKSDLAAIKTFVRRPQ